MERCQESRHTTKRPNPCHAYTVTFYAHLHTQVCRKSIQCILTSKPAIDAPPVPSSYLHCKTPIGKLYTICHTLDNPYRQPPIIPTPNIVQYWHIFCYYLTQFLGFPNPTNFQHLERTEK